MTSGKKLDRETVDYLRTLPEIVRRVQGGRIYYTNSFRTQATARYAMGDRPVDIFRDNGIGPEVIGYKRIERCIARWKENPDELSTVDSRFPLLHKTKKQTEPTKGSEAHRGRNQIPRAAGEENPTGRG